MRGLALLVVTTSILLSCATAAEVSDSGTRTESRFVEGVEVAGFFISLKEFGPWNLKREAKSSGPRQSGSALADYFEIDSYTATQSGLVSQNRRETAPAKSAIFFLTVFDSDRAWKSEKEKQSFLEAYLSGLIAQYRPHLLGAPPSVETADRDDAACAQLTISTRVENVYGPAFTHSPHLACVHHETGMAVHLHYSERFASAVSAAATERRASRIFSTLSKR